MRYPRKTSGAEIMKTITSARRTPMIGRPSILRKRLLALSGPRICTPLVQRDHPRGQGGEVALDVAAGPATRLDALDEGEDLPDFADRERGGGLVEHDQVGLEVHRARDGDALALAAREVPHGRLGRDAVTAEADRAPQEVVCDLLLLLDVDEAEPPGDLPPHEEVPPKGLLLAQRLPLVDGLDAQGVRLPNRELRGGR